MMLLDFSTVLPREIAPGFVGRYVHSDQITQGRVDIAPGRPDSRSFPPARAVDASAERLLRAHRLRRHPSSSSPFAPGGKEVVRRRFNLPVPQDAYPLIRVPASQ